MVSSDAPPMDKFDALSAIGKDYLAAEQEKETEELQLCLNAARRGLHAFLDDPEKVARYNAHLDTIIERHFMHEPSPFEKFYFEQLKIRPERIDVYKEIAFSIGIKKQENLIDIAGSSEIAVNDDFMNVMAENADRRKWIIHEMMHGIVTRNCIRSLSCLSSEYFEDYTAQWIKKYDLSESQYIPLRHVEELGADSLSDHVQIWPLMRDVLDRSQIGLYKHAGGSAENLQAFLDKIKEKRLDEQDYEGHPSDLKRSHNSERVADSLAGTRTNDYLDRIYDGYVPGHDDTGIVMYRINKEDALQKEQALEALTQSKPASKKPLTTI